MAVVALLLRTTFQNNFLQALGLTLLLLPVEILLSVVLREVYRRSKLPVSFPVRPVGWVVALSLVAACVETLVAHGLLHALGWASPSWTSLEAGLLRVITMWLVYMTWGMGYFWVKSEYSEQAATRRGQRLQTEAQRIELQLLRAQLDPHFLFHSLDGIASEIKTNPDAAVEMVDELSDYLRYSLEQRNRLIAPLDVELEAMRAYLRIEQARFGDQLNVSIEVTDDARHRLVPSFLLQPLVENAVKHGFKAGPPPWNLTIRATTHVDKLIVEVSNNGRLTTESFKLAGAGLESLQDRLSLLYSDRSQFALENHEGRVRAILDLDGDPCAA